VEGDRPIYGAPVAAGKENSQETAPILASSNGKHHFNGTNLLQKQTMEQLATGLVRSEQTMTATDSVHTMNKWCTSAKCKSVWKPHPNLPDTRGGLASASMFFQMLPGPPGAEQSALRLCKSILRCF